MNQALEATDRSPERIRLPFRPDIEGMRALAIVLVVISHCGVPILVSGFIGVDVFFVLSGFLITSLLIEELRLTGSISLSRFYARRARRLLPAVLLMVFVVSIVESILISPIVQWRVLRAALATILYASNFYFAHINLHYFGRLQSVSPLVHTWSLAVEEQFYLVWPLLLFLLAKAGKSRKRVVIPLIVIAVVSFAWCVFLSRSDPLTAFYHSPARIWEFCAGALILYIPLGWLTGHKRVCTWLGIAGFVALIVCGQWMNSTTFPGYTASFPVIGTMAILLAGTGAPDSLIPRLLSTRPALLLGRLSYSLYLWHWPSLIIGRQFFPSDSTAVRFTAIAVAVVLAFITHKLVENPIRFNPFLASRSGLTLRLALFATVLLICAVGGWRLALSHSVQFNRFNAVERDTPAMYTLGCVPDLPDPHPRQCIFGDTDHPFQTVVLIGDSHAAEWFPALEAIVENEHWRLVTLVKPGCTPLDLKEDISPLMDHVCAEWRSQSLESIQALRPDLVLVAAASIHPGANKMFVTDTAVWQQASRNTFTALTQRASQVRLIRDTPHADYNVLECLAQSEWDGRTRCVPINPATALYPEIYDAEVRGAAGLPNFGAVDLTDAICTLRDCPAEIDGMVVYRDADHMTATFNRSLAQVLNHRLTLSLHPNVRLDTLPAISYPTTKR